MTVVLVKGLISRVNSGSPQTQNQQHKTNEVGNSGNVALAATTQNADAVVNSLRGTGRTLRSERIRTEKEASDLAENVAGRIRGGEDEGGETAHSYLNSGTAAEHFA